MNIELEVVTEGLEFPEGPVAMHDGSVILVEVARGTLTRVHPDGRTEVIADLGGGPNGVAIGPDGAAYVTNNGGFNWMQKDGLTVPYGTPDDYKSGSIQRVDLSTGEAVTLYDRCDGLPLNGPNDLMFDADGGFWFTDLGKSNRLWEHHGQIFYARPDGSSITRVRADRITPNGIGISPNGRTLYVAETATARLWAFGIEGPGKLAASNDPWLPGRLLNGPPGYYLFDSLAIEADGRVCVATLGNGGITVFDPSDDTVGHVPVPDRLTTNICFGGDDMQTAWITASGTGKLYRCRWPRPGLKLHFNA